MEQQVTLYLRLSWRLESGFKAAVLCILCKVITKTIRFNWEQKKNKTCLNIMLIHTDV